MVTWSLFDRKNLKPNQLKIKGYLHNATINIKPNFYIYIYDSNIENAHPTIINAVPISSIVVFFTSASDKIPITGAPHSLITRESHATVPIL